MSSGWHLGFLDRQPHYESYLLIGDLVIMVDDSRHILGKMFGFDFVMISECGEECQRLRICLEESMFTILGYRCQPCYVENVSVLSTNPEDF